MTGWTLCTWSGPEAPWAYLLCVWSRVADADEDTGEAQASNDSLVDLGQGHVPPQGPAARPCHAYYLHIMQCSFACFHPF